MPNGQQSMGVEKVQLYRMIARTVVPTSAFRQTRGGFVLNYDNGSDGYVRIETSTRGSVIDISVRGPTGNEISSGGRQTGFTCRLLERTRPRTPRN